MGAGIAQLALEAGHEVLIHDVDPAAIERGRGRIRAGLERRARRLDLDPDTAEAWVDGRLSRLRAAATLDVLTDADPGLVIEAVLEDLAAKRAILRALDAATWAEAILATNTSALSVEAIARATVQPARVLGLHFFNPAPVMPLVEVVVAPSTDPAVAERATRLMIAWGKVTVRCADTPGFIVNRVNRPFTLEALAMLAAGDGSVGSIDAAVRAAGYPMGPFELMDLVGIDINLAAAMGIFERARAAGDPLAERFRPSPIQERLVAAGRLGRKTGEGFYAYDASGTGDRACCRRRHGPDRPPDSDGARDGPQPRLPTSQNGSRWRSSTRRTGRSARESRRSPTSTWRCAWAPGTRSGHSSGLTSSAEPAAVLAALRRHAAMAHASSQHRPSSRHGPDVPAPRQGRTPGRALTVGPAVRGCRPYNRRVTRPPDRPLREAWIVEAVRTPIGRYGGALASVRPDDLAAAVLRALVDRAGLDPALVEDVILGCANQAGEDNRNVARMALLLAGFPVEVGGQTVNRLCGSGLQAINSRGPRDRGRRRRRVHRRRRRIDDPRAVRPAQGRVGIRPRTARHGRYDPRLAVRQPAPRRAPLPVLDGRDRGERRRAVGRQPRAPGCVRAREPAARRRRHRGRPVRRSDRADSIPQQKGEPLVVDRDEHPRADTTLEALARLRPAFKTEGGSVTAGNSSGINDGASAVLLVEAGRARELGLKPLARVVSTAVAGVDPAVMGIGPIPATRKALERAGIGVADLDLVELNEAFASQSLVCIDELGLDPARVNVNGGAIALGHPLGMSGGRLITMLTHELRRTGGRFGLATMCIGVGQGIATIVERLDEG